MDKQLIGAGLTSFSIGILLSAVTPVWQLNLAIGLGIIGGLHLWITGGKKK